jgi:predicted nucleotidyltransferase
MTVNALESQQSALAALCRRFHVRRLDIFGSAANGSFDPSRSDLDFLVSFESCTPADHYERYFGLLESLQALFDRPIDLLESEAVRNPYLLQSVNETRVLLYAA